MFKIDPKYRKHNHRNITFAMMYNYAENYLLPLSHDEVVHGKESLLKKCGEMNGINLQDLELSWDI